MYKYVIGLVSILDQVLLEELTTTLVAALLRPVLDTFYLDLEVGQGESLNIERNVDLQLS